MSIEYEKVGSLRNDDDTGNTRAPENKDVNGGMRKNNRAARALVQSIDVVCEISKFKVKKPTSF